MTNSLQLARPMMGRRTCFDANEARRQLLKKWQNVSALESTANDYITRRVNAVDLKNRFGDVETDCRDRLHLGSSSESWGLNSTQTRWHFRGGAVHSIKSGHSHCSK
jgi:hypothetical protein